MRRTFVLLTVVGFASLAPCFVGACGNGDGGGPVTGSDSGPETSLADSSTPPDSTSGGSDAGIDAPIPIDSPSGGDATDAGSAADSDAAQAVNDGGDAGDDAADASDAGGTVMVTIDF